MKYLTLFLSLFVIAISSGCATPQPESGQVITERNHLGRVAKQSGDTWSIKTPPAVKFTGEVATSSEIYAWALMNGITANMGQNPDALYAQLEAGSALEAAKWLKRFNWDTRYEWVAESRDCDNFARRFRAFPDLFDSPVAAQAAVFSIYVTYDSPFAGIADGRHALNVVWTDRGVFVFEPQGIDVIYQLLEDWPNLTGITDTLKD